MNAQWIAMLGLVLVVFSSNSGLAQESKSSSWWPFGSSKSESETRSSSFFGTSAAKPKTSSSSWFKLPSWSRTKNSASSTVSRMGATSKRWMYNTADFLNPFNDGKPATQQPHGYQTETWSNRKPKEEKKTGMFGWMWKEEEEEEIKSVNDFLAQPMPY